MTEAVGPRELIGLAVFGFVLFFVDLHKYTFIARRLRWREPQTVRNALIGWLFLTGLLVLLGALLFIAGGRRDAGGLAGLSAFALGGFVGFITFWIHRSWLVRKRPNVAKTRAVQT